MGGTSLPHLKEQLLWVRHFRNLEELRATLLEFRDRYNQHWIDERRNYRTPVQYDMI